MERDGTDTFHLVGIILRFLTRSREGGPGYSLVETLVRPGGGPPLNRHPDDDEAFYVLEGRMRITVGARSFEAGPGEFVQVPRGEAHAFVNIGTAPARMLVLNVPGRLHDRFFSQAGEPLPSGTTEFPEAAPPDVPRLLEIARKNGIEFLPPPH